MFSKSQKSPRQQWNAATWHRQQLELLVALAPSVVNRNALSEAKTAETYAAMLCVFAAESLDVDGHGLSVDDRRAICGAHDAGLAGVA